ncbi:MAG: HD domain-containing protein [Candidatus Alkaliphilus sp. MAG34]
MERVNCILEDTGFLEHIAKIKKLEKDRIFCRHDLNHLLDVCRIAWILNLEEKLLIDKDKVYAAALLHDIGRWVEYETGQDHAIISGELAEDILDRCGFSESEKTDIIGAIKGHRKKEHSTDLGRILYRADKLSRPCFNCEAIDQCKKSQQARKQALLY